MEFSFPTTHRLKSRKTISAIFDQGKAVKAYPLLFTYITVSEEPKRQMGFSVSKRRFKKAVDRNRVKRLLREAYRLNQSLLDPAPTNLRVMIIYLGRDLPELSFVEEKFKQGVERLLTELRKTA